MAMFFFLLCLFSVLCLILGLMKPTIVLRRGERTRVKVLKFYSLLILLSFVAFAIFVKKEVDDKWAEQSVTTPSQPNPAPVASGPATKPTSTSVQEFVQDNMAEERELYCSFIKELWTRNRDLEAKEGLSPEQGRQPGQIIVLENDINGTLTPQVDKEKSKGVFKIFKGTRVKILERYFYGKRYFYGYRPGEMVYKVAGIGIKKRSNVDILDSDDKNTVKVTFMNYMQITEAKKGEFQEEEVIGFVDTAFFKLKSDNLRQFLKKQTDKKIAIEEELHKKYPQVGNISYEIKLGNDCLKGVDKPLDN
ncbi:MAG: hypothetical protein HQK81_06235 [Desulfovibrionaceae bacterium]|nr:hypothetical protein [Desulfovibrionaceae bacterium]MBF0513648.1 hypothetical protein [Desulfovibrionaceae bacterium]